MSSAEKKRQYSLRRLFLHRKASSISAISAPWGLTVASFRPAPLPSAGGSTPDLRQLSLENTMLVSRESDSNGLLAQRRARDMPVPLHRSASLGYPTSSDVPAVTKRYEASTMCEKFVLPRPRLVALTITPPSSPQGEAAAQSTSYTTQPEVARIGRRSALLVEEYERERGRDSPSVLSGFRVMRQGRERDSEREEWAEKTRAATMSTAAGHGGGLRMRLPSATRETERDQDHKYLMARFAPQPVAYERVHGLDDTSRQNDNNDDEVVPPPFPLSRRKKGRSGSLGNLIAGPFMKKDRVATNSGTGTRSSADPPIPTTTQGYHGHQRRASEPAPPSFVTTFAFLRQWTQSPRKSRPAQATMMTVSSPFSVFDKPLPPEPTSTTETVVGPPPRRSDNLRHSASSPNLRGGALDLPLMSTTTSPIHDDAHQQPFSMPRSMDTIQYPSRDSAVNLLSNSDVVDRLAHPTLLSQVKPGQSAAAPPPIHIFYEPQEGAPVQAERTEPFTPTRQAAWDQWHTMHDDPAAGGSPNLPERLPLETVRALAVRQMTSPRQKKPSMEEAVNRARIAKQLFGEPLPSPPLPPQPPQRSSGRSSQEPTSYLGLSAAAAVGEHHNRLYSAYAGSQPPSSPHALAIGNGSPQTSRLMPMTPGSTDASPMPGASFDDIEKDLFFTRPRRLWGPPVTLPSRNGEEGQLRSNTCIVDHLPYDTRRSKDSGESAPSTRIVSTSDESSRDVHGHVEIATPNFSQNGGGGGANHHDRSRFPAISEEERPNSTSSDRIIRINGNEDDNETTFHDHRWMQKGFLPRDASSNTILNFHEVEARRPEEPRRASNMVEKLGDTSFTPDRTSVVPESGRLDDSSDNDSADSLAVLSNKDGRKGFLAPFLVPPPEVAHNDSAYSSASDINSFVSARSAATIKASHSEHPAVSRQNTDMTTMSYATANSKPL